MNFANDRRGVILCSHVSSNRLPILYGERNEPIDAADSGWQFLCNSGVDENEHDATLWAVCELVTHEPSLLPFIDKAVGTRIIRTDKGSSWTILPPV
jgi:hypothetical protein